LEPKTWQKKEMWKNTENQTYNWDGNKAPASKHTQIQQLLKRVLLILHVQFTAEIMWPKGNKATIHYSWYSHW
jgi:hypothetical protein